MYKTISEMTEEDKQRLKEICGTIICMLEEGHSDDKIANELNLGIFEVYRNSCQMLRVLRNYVGRWKYFKILFRK